MERLYASYNDDIEFLIVYIREAHPNLLKKENYNAGILDQPKNIHERIILATKCVTQFKLTIPMVIDDMDGKVNKDYKAFPVRVTVVDVDGKVVFYAGKGPRDFRIPPVERTLRKLITNGGHMPPSPAPQWGETVNGVRCGFSIDPEHFALGEPVAAQLRFENTMDESINFFTMPRIPSNTSSSITATAKPSSCNPLTEVEGLVHASRRIRYRKSIRGNVSRQTLRAGSSMPPASQNSRLVPFMQCISIK